MAYGEGFDRGELSILDFGGQDCYIVSANNLQVQGLGTPLGPQPLIHDSTGFQWYTQELEAEEGFPSLQDAIKEILTELLHSDELDADLLERLADFKAAFELQEDEFRITRKRLKLAEQILRKRL